MLDVYTVAPDGSALRRVTDGDLTCSAPRWSPEGERLVIAARDPTDEQREYLERRRDDGPIEV
ncbi:hypothetical protein BRC94_07300, partial [Halobacteriales archaeon QS_5_70_17]